MLVRGGGRRSRVGGRRRPGPSGAVVRGVYGRRWNVVEGGLRGVECWNGVLLLAMKVAFVLLGRVV